MATMQCKPLAIMLGVFLLLSAESTNALGINCRGSALCGSYNSHVMSQINTLVQGQPDDSIWGNGEHIACAGSICAFLQNIGTSPPTKTGAQIKGYVYALLNHGCTVCGSDPTEPGNNVNFGELTVNYVS